MNAFHTLRTHGENFSMPRFELLVMIISALEWRKHNGHIKLVTDRRGADYLNQLSLADIYDDIDASLDEMNALDIDEKTFWAGAKLFALRRQQCPCVMLDLDFIVWQPIDFAPYQNDVAVIHFETVGNDVYPPPEYFRFKDGFQFPPTLDWTARACNTAFAYFGARDLVARYCDFAFKFMQSAAGEGLPYMVFIEQRWLAMCARLMRRKVHELSSLDDLFRGRQKYFTHVWGAKQKLRDNPELADKFCADCLERLQYDFPKLDVNKLTGR